MLGQEERAYPRLDLEILVVTAQNGFESKKFVKRDGTGVPLPVGAQYTEGRGLIKCRVTRVELNGDENVIIHSIEPELGKLDLKQMNHLRSPNSGWILEDL